MRFAPNAPGVVELVKRTVGTGVLPDAPTKMPSVTGVRCTSTKFPPAPTAPATTDADEGPSGPSVVSVSPYCAFAVASVEMSAAVVALATWVASNGQRNA